MVKKIMSFKLMGTTITVCEGDDELSASHRRELMEIKNKPLFKYIERRSIAKPQLNRQPLMKLPLKVIEAIKSAEGTNLTLLMEKKLKGTDIDKYQNRIYVAKNMELMGYLTEYEKQSAEKQGIEGELDVTVIDPRAEVYNIKLKQRTNSNKYALIKEWGRLVRHNGLRRDDSDNGLRRDGSVEIWCFRVASKLCLVVNAETRTDWGRQLGLGQAIGA